MTAAFGPMDVNSGNQRWSRWTFVVEADRRKRPSVRECLDNFRKWCALGFKSSAGRAKVERTHGRQYEFTVEIEGPPAHDPDYRAAVREQFARHFVAKGFGWTARLVSCEASLLAGTREDGTPADQLLVLPTLVLPHRTL